MHRRFALLLALAVSAASLSGCVALKSVGGVQQDVVGKLRLTLVICKVDGGATINHPGCAYQSNGGEGGTTVSQLLLGFRAPAGTSAPATVLGTTNDPAPKQLTFARSAGYEAELSRLLPLDAGLRWIGYLADAYTYAGGANGTPARELSVAVDLGLPSGPDGGPFVGPFSVTPVVGARGVDAGMGMPASRPVACGDSLFAISGGGTICVDSPVAANVGFPYNFATRDYGIVAGRATASPGQTVTLPFGVRGAGALPAGLTATLAAATNLPGATVAPSQPTAALSNGSNTRVTVPVAIPKKAGPGVFDVTLTGKLANGQTRVGTAKLTVRDRQAPVLSALKAKPKRFRAATRKRPKRGTTISFAFSEVGTVRVVVERCSKRARNRRTGKRTGRCVRFKAMKGAFTKPGVKGANSFRFKGRLRGKALKAGPYRLKVTPTDAASNRGEAVRARFAIRR